MVFVLGSLNGNLIKSFYEYTNAVESYREIVGLEMFSNQDLFIAFNEGDYTFVTFYSLVTNSIIYAKKFGDSINKMKINDLHYSPTNKLIYEGGTLGGKLLNL